MIDNLGAYILSDLIFSLSVDKVQWMISKIVYTHDK